MLTTRSHDVFSKTWETEFFARIREVKKSVYNEDNDDNVKHSMVRAQIAGKNDSSSICAGDTS